MRESILKHIRLLVALPCLTLLANFVAAANNDQHDPLALRTYYSDLYLKFSQYEIDDVPFQQKQVVVLPKDTLLAVAKRNPIAKLDSYHLAAALYEANAPLFANGSFDNFRTGASIKMPTVGDIFYAQTRYEKLKVVGNTLVFTHQENQMRNGIRSPFANAFSTTGPIARAELPRKPATTHVVVNTNKEAGTTTIAVEKKELSVTPKAEEQDASENSLATNTAIENDNYLGPPKTSTVSASNQFSSDPLSSIVEWKYNDTASVGTVLNMLARYVGYELNSTDEIVLNTYTRKLPTLQRNISGITAEEGFLLLSGRGLETVFDHANRTVKHIPGKSTPSELVTNTSESSKLHEKIVEASGISSMLRQFPTDILSAAGQHANRCESSAPIRQPDVDRLYREVIGRLQQSVPQPVARNLLDWYESPTGRKVLMLAEQQIDATEFQRFSISKDRHDRINTIYNNTVTGRGITNIAVELDYAGWALSGCKQKAEISGDVQKMNKEMTLGQDIKKKLAKLESILRDDMLRSLAFQFSTLSDRELTEYTNVISEHAGTYAGLGQSIVDAIELETQVITLSSLD